MPSQNGHQPTPNEDCANLRDFLPFYVAGTLSMDVHASVQTHLVTCEDCRALVTAWKSVAHVVRAAAELRVGANVPNLNLSVESRIHRGHRTMMTPSLSINSDALNHTTYGRNARKSARRYGLVTGLLAMFAALVLMSIQIIGRVMPLGQYAAPNPTTPAQTIFDTLQPITAQNADQLRIISRFGRGTVRDIDWSPDGTTLAIAATTGVYLYTPDAETPERDSDSPYVTQKLGDSSAKITALDHSPDGQTLAVVADTQVELWDAVTGEVIETFYHPYDSLDVEFSPDGIRLMTTVCTQIIDRAEDNCDNLFSLRVFRIDDPTINGGTSGLTRGTAAFRPDSDGFAYAIWSDTINASIIIHTNLWHTESGSYLLENQEVQQIRYSPDGTRLAVLGRTLGASATGGATMMTIFDITEPLTLEEPISSVLVERDIRGFEFAEDGTAVRYITKSASTTSQMYRERIISEQTQTQIRFGDALSDIVMAVFSSQAETPRFAAYDTSGRISIWDVDLALERVDLKHSARDFLSGIFGLAFAPATLPQPLIALKNGNKVEVWDYSEGLPFDRIDTDFSYFSYGSMDFSSSGLLAFPLDTPSQQPSFWESQIALWDMETGYHRGSLGDDPGMIHTIAFDERDTLIGVAARIEPRGVWRTNESGEYVLIPIKNVNNPYHFANAMFSEDGRVVSFTGCLASTLTYECTRAIGVLVFDVVTGEELVEIEAGFSLLDRTNQVLRITEESIVVAAYGCSDMAEAKHVVQDMTYFTCEQLRLLAWDISDVLNGTSDTPQELFSISADLTARQPLVISADATLIAARTEVDTLSIIEVRTGEIIANLPFTQYIFSLTFNDEGTLLAVGGEGTITLYGVPAEQP